MTTIRQGSGEIRQSWRRQYRSRSRVSHPIRMFGGMATASRITHRSHLRLVHRVEGSHDMSNAAAHHPSHFPHASAGASAHPSRGRLPRLAIDDLDAEHRLLEAIARRNDGRSEAQCRMLTIWARGFLADGRVLWSGSEATWGVIEPVLAELLGWDATSPRPVRAEVHSEFGRHEVLAVQSLRPVGAA